MVQILAKLGWRLTWNSSREQRSRLVQMVVSCAAFCLLAAIAASFVAVGSINAERNTKRLPIGTQGGIESPGVPLADQTSLPFLGGRQFEIRWFEHHAPVLIREFGGPQPMPGEAFVSPALIHDAGGATEVQRRFGIVVSAQSKRVDWTRILAHSGEYLAFATLPGDRRLAESPSRKWLTGFGPTAHTTILDVDAIQGGIVPPAGAEVVVGGSIDERIPSVLEAGQFSLWFLVLPGVMVLVSGFGATSTVREERRAALAELGASRGQRLIPDLVETTTAALIAVALIAPPWIMTARQLERFPFTRLRFLAGDAGLSARGFGWWLMACLAVPAIVGTATRSAVRWRSPNVALRSASVSAGALALPPLVAIAATFLPRDLAPLSFFVLVAVSVAVLQPVGRGALAALGLALTSSHRHGSRAAVRLVAGRTFASGDRRCARVLTLGGACMLTLSVVFGLLLRGYEPPAIEQRLPGTVTVEWKDSTLDDAHDLLAHPAISTLPAAVVGIEGGTDGNVRSAPASAERTLVVPTCDAARRLLGIHGDCGTDDAKAVAEGKAIAERLGLRLAVTTELPKLTDVSLLVRVEDAADNDAIQSAVTSSFGPASVTGFDRLGPRPYTAWLGALGALAIAALVLAYGVFVLNTVKDESPSLLAVRTLNPPHSTVRNIQRIQILLPVAVGELLGALLGVLISNTGQGLELTRIPWTQLASAALFMLVFAATSVELGIRYFDPSRPTVGSSERRRAGNTGRRSGEG